MKKTENKPVVVTPLPLDAAVGATPLRHPAHDLLDQILLMASHTHVEARTTINALVGKIRETL